jgi:hypothetical protein
MKRKLDLAGALGVVTFLGDDLDGSVFGVGGVEEIDAGRRKMVIFEGDCMRAGR